MRRRLETSSTRTGGGSRTARAVLLMAVLVAAVAVSHAAERVHFANGHVLVVEKVREEGDKVFLMLRDGSEVGFPKQLIAEVERGPRIQNRASTADRGNSMRSLGFVNPRDSASRPGQGARVIGHGTLKGIRDGEKVKPQTVGFSEGGSGWGNSRDPATRPVRDLRDARREQLSKEAPLPGTALPTTKDGMPSRGLLGAPRLADRIDNPKKTDGGKE